MSHSVEGHLKLDIGDYDRLIRQLVPAYAAMRPIHLDLLALALPKGEGLVLDLGGGTGALAADILERFPKVSVEIWDTDPAMLAVAKGRCARFGSRVRLVERSFTEPLTACNAVAACIALHHVKDMGVKAGIYREIYAALKPGGIFVNADTAAPSGGPLRNHVYELWAKDMGKHGISRKEAYDNFAQWAKEDYYPPLFEELSLLKAAGFAEPECFWRDAAAVVFGGTKS